MRVRKSLLAATALFSAAVPIAAHAESSYTLGGGAPVAINPALDPAILTGLDTQVVIGSDQNSAITVNTTTAATSAVTVDSGASVNSAAYGIWSLNMTSDATVSNNGTVTATGNGITVDSRFAPDGGSVTVNGTGTVNAGGLGVWLLADSQTGAVSLDGQTGGVNAGTDGVLINANGSYAGNAGGAINIGQLVQLGPIVAGSDGIYIDQVANPAGDGDINARVGNITANGGYGIRAIGWTGNTNIVLNGNVASTSAAVYGTATTGDQTLTVNGGTVRARADNGLVLDSRFAPDGGNVTFTGTGTASVTSDTASAIWALADGQGIVTIDGFAGGIHGATWGILVNSNGTWTNQPGGAVDIGQNGALGSINANLGIDVIQQANANGDGAIRVTSNAITTTGSYGIHTLAWTAPTAITANGTLNTADTSIYATSTTGAINATANGSVSSQNHGIYTRSTTGVQAITTNGIVTAVTNGIDAATTTGAINIISNAALTGGTNGILAVSSDGPVTITTNARVIGRSSAGGTAGIVTNTTASSAANTVNVNADAFGGSAGLFTNSGSGVTTTNIARGATVYGDNYGDVAWFGNQIVNNAGTITTTPDHNMTLSSTGPSKSTIAYWSGSTTSSVLNNSGMITGQLYVDAGTSNVINNLGSGVINLSASAQTTLGTTLNNRGLVNIYAGATTLIGNRFNNVATGVLDLTKNSAVTDSLTVQNFSAQGGSRIRMNLNVNAALGAEDRGTTGNSDTVFVVGGVSSPQAGSFIDFVPVGGDAAALTGSVALVYTGKAMEAPLPGTQIVASSNYLVGSVDPSTGARVYRIVDDGQGGAYLQWVPNISAASMGAFLGGDLSTRSGRNSAIAAAGGAKSGSASAASHVADLSASDAGGQCFAGGRRPHLWANASVDQTDLSQGEGDSEALSMGFEAPVGRSASGECGQTVIGWFGYTNWGTTTFSTGATKNNGYGVGGYVRTARANGIYAHLLGSAGAVDSRVSNGIFRSTANADGFTWSTSAAMGFTNAISAKSRFDLRGSVTRAVIDYARFLDSKGFAVQDMKSKTWDLAGTLGLSTKFDDRTIGFVRGGIKWTSLARTTQAYDIRTAGASNVLFESAELGLNSSLSDTVQIGAAAFGDFASGYTRYGGRAYLRVAL